MSSIILNSSHIIDSINNSTIQIDFERSVWLFDKHIALTSASLYFSWRNITSSNNKFSYIWIDDVEYSVELPIGIYDISDIRTYFQYVMTQKGHVMTNTKTDSTIFFIDKLVNNTNSSIDIVTDPVPTTLPEGFTSSITFPSVAKNPRLKLPSGMNDILVMMKVSPLMLLVRYKHTIQPKRPMYRLIVVYYGYVTKLKINFQI
jgi:hypothetical protein